MGIASDNLTFVATQPENVVDMRNALLFHCRHSSFNSIIMIHMKGNLGRNYGEKKGFIDVDANIPLNTD